MPRHSRNLPGYGRLLRLPRGLRWLAAPLLLALPGCMMGPDYKRPTVDTPAEFRAPTPPPATSANSTAAPGNATAPSGNATASTGNSTATPSPASLADLAWWQVYNDPVLQELLQEALKNNYDVQIAVQDVEQARQLAYEQQSFLYPQVGYGGTVSRGRNQVLGTLQPQNGSYNSSTSLQVGLSWEIDLWGKIRRADEAARAELLATVEAQRGVWLSLVSDVASTYFQLLGEEAQLQVAKNATQTYTETLNLFEERLQGGVASLLDTSSAAGALGAASAQVPDIERQIAETENQLSVLLGRNPGPIPRGIVLTSQTFPPDVPAGLPSQLLERRPDILQAEAQVKAANAQIGVAKANFFPQLSLTSALGKVSPEVSAFTGGGANAWSIAAGLAGPIFEGGLLTAQYKGAQAVWKQSVLQYQQTVLNAFAEVSDALIEREKLAEVRAQQEYSVSSYSEAVDVSIKRYIAGKASYYEVLDAQTKLFPNEANLVNTREAELQAMVNLYMALGGGWSLKDAAFVNGPTPPIPPPDFSTAPPISATTTLPAPFMAPSNLMGKPQPVTAPTSFPGSVANPTSGTASPAHP
ncbi:MAG: efflux transporter outer membrane subunit [Opitutales bacterium]|jgi:multidrug efflux system outer membrane protein